MGIADKVLTVTMRFRPDGAPFIVDATTKIAGLGDATERAQRQTNAFNLTALRQNQIVEGVSAKLRAMLLSVSALAGAGGLGLLVKRSYDYGQELESVRISIAAILAANRQYVDSNGQLLDANAAFVAGLKEVDQLLPIIEKKALATSATVPQIADAFQTALSASKAAGLNQNLDKILETTVRIVQAAGAFKVPMDQLRQEVNSLFMGEITEDSQIAKKLGFDNASVKKLIATGKLYEEIIRRTEAIAVAAAAQSNTLSGVIVNTMELVDSTVSKGLKNALGGVRDYVVKLGEVIAEKGPEISGVIAATTAAIGGMVRSLIDWTRQHADLVKEIAAIGAVALVAIGAYGAIGAAVAAITSPVGIAIAVIVALALAWEKVREFGEIEVAGRPLSAYMRATFALVGNAAAMFVENLLTIFKALWHGAAGIFGSLVEVVIAPMRALTFFLSDIPDSVAALVPGATQIRSAAAAIRGLLDTTSASFEPLENFKAIATDVGENWRVNAALLDQTFEQVQSSLESKKGLPSIADAVFGGVSEAFRKRLAEIRAAAAGAAKDTSPPATRTGNPNASDKGVPQQVRDAFNDYLAFIEEVRAKGRAVGDPVAEALNEIEKQRRAALRKIDEARANAKFAPLGHDFGKDVADANTAFDKQAIEVTLHANEQALKAVRDQTRSYTREIENERIATIRDANERTLAERLHANEEWFGAEKERIESEIKVESTKSTMLARLADEKKRRDARDQADAKKKREEELVGFAAWAERVRNAIRDQIGSVPAAITAAVLSSVDAIRSGFDQLFDSLRSGQLDIGKSLEDFGKQLGSVWSRVLSGILTRSVTTGESVMSQLREMTKQANGLTGVNAGLAGAGVGSLVGGIGQSIKPNSNAGIGGTIGGALGAVVGSFFSATAIGAYIGSAIGTAIGAAIQKGKDQIGVEIAAAANGSATAAITETGISAEARGRVSRDVRRQVNDVIKGYRSIVDLFPETLREQIRAAVLPISVRGGVESADINDENALGALSTFLSETMPKGVFDAYSAAIRKGLSLLGVSETRIDQEFARMGELQGKELQDAVRAYVGAVSDTTKLRNKYQLPFDDMLAEARTSAAKNPLANLSDVNGQLATMVASLSQLDVVDQITAINQINQLTEQKYANEIAYLQRIDAIQKSIADSSQNLRDQIKLAGLSDDGKLDFFFERMRELRGQLQVTTDPEQVQAITQQIHGYVSQALGLGGNSEAMRDQLGKIVDDIQAISDSQLGKARDEVEQQHRATAELMQTAAETLLKASQALLDVTAPEPTPKHPDHGGPIEGEPPFKPTPSDPSTPQVGGLALAPIATATSAALGRVADLAAAHSRIGSVTAFPAAPALPASMEERWTDMQDGVALAVSMLQKLDQQSTAGADQTQQTDTIIALLTRIADRDDRELHISGDGTSLLDQFGLQIEERIVRRIRNDRDIVRRFAD